MWPEIVNHVLYINSFKQKIFQCKVENRHPHSHSGLWMAYCLAPEISLSLQLVDDTSHVTAGTADIPTRVVRRHLRAAAWSRDQSGGFGCLLLPDTGPSLISACSVCVLFAVSVLLCTIVYLWLQLAIYCNSSMYYIFQCSQKSFNAKLKTISILLYCGQKSFNAAKNRSMQSWKLLVFCYTAAKNRSMQPKIVQCKVENY